MRAWLWTLVGAASLSLPQAASGQEAPRVTVRVRQVAGTSVYLDIGTRHGLATGDTLPVAADSAGRPAGLLVVSASTESRSVLTFTAEAFPITRGDRLTLLLLREPAEEGVATDQPPPVEARPDPAAVRGELASGTRTPGPVPVPPAQRFAPPAHGRVAMEVSAVRSVTTVGGADPLEVDRTFATPALRFDVTAPQAVGGFTLHTSARVAYRYSDGPLLESTSSARVYAASLEREFTRVPLRVMLGRFYSPVERYSGVWDGAMFRVGRSFGVGAMVGFEPDRWNERPSTELPKFSAFVDGRARGSGWRWSGDLSAHTMRPADSLSSHTYLGASQRITLGPLSLSHDLQLDQVPSDSKWQLSRVRIRASLDLSSALSLRGGFSRRETYVLSRSGSPFAPRNDRYEAGVAVRAGTAFLAADASVSEDVAGNRSQGVTGSLDTGGLIAGGVALAGSVSGWTGPYGNSLSAAPGLDLDIGDVRVRMGYRYNRSDYLDRTVETRGASVYLDTPLGGGMRASVRGRVQWGGSLLSQGVDLTLYRIF